MTETVDTVVIGGGQAGLATSYHLGRRGIDHVVLERSDRAGSAWRDGRWDSFTLVTPNWTFQLPGAEYDGPDAGGFMPRDAILARFDAYVSRHSLPLRFGTSVTAVERDAARGSYLVRTDDDEFAARNVVVATGLFQTPKVPAIAADLPGGILQLHSAQYRNPDALPSGAVLVVGSAQSGAQIAQELHEHGRDVYLCVGGAGRVPRRYRGRDIVEWLNVLGWFDRTVEALSSPKARFAAMPHVSGRDGGRTLNLHEFARAGVNLLGHVSSVEGGAIVLASDLAESLTKADRFEAMITGLIDAHIARHGVDAPPETLPVLRDGFDVEARARLDLSAAGVTTVIWAVGYAFDFGVVKLPVTDSDGYPVQRRGATQFPGLYFMGLPWLYKQKSGLLLGVGADAEYVASSIAERSGG